MMNVFDQTYPFTTPQLTFDVDALEPYIDAQTMEIHHDKHHAGYVTKLNAALESHTKLHTKTLGELLSNLEKLPANIQKDIDNNGGGHANHSLFWNILSPIKTPASDDLIETMTESFGSFEAMQDLLIETATKHFGSGWAWIVINQKGSLEITTTPNQDSPLTIGHTPILGIDVWEHAYYLHYQNRRPDYIKAILQIINWKNVSDLYAETITTR